MSDNGLHITDQVMTKLSFLSLRFKDAGLASEFEEYLFKKNEAVVRSNAVHVISPFLNLISLMVYGLSFFADTATGLYVHSSQLSIAGLSSFSNIVFNYCATDPHTLPVVSAVFLLIFNFTGLTIDKNMKPHTFRIYTRMMAFSMTSIFIAISLTTRNYSYGFRGDYSLPFLIPIEMQILICTYMLRTTFFESTLIVLVMVGFDNFDSHIVTGG